MRLEALVARQQVRRLVLAPNAAQRLGAGPIGAAQIRVEFGGTQEKRRGGGMIALLQERLAEEIRGIGIVRIAGSRLLEPRRSQLRFAEIEMHDAARVERPQVIRLGVKHLAQNGERQPFVAFLLPVQGGDGLVHASIQPVRRQRESRHEGPFRVGILVARHQGNASVVVRHGLVRRRSTLVNATAGEANGQGCG